MQAKKDEHPSVTFIKTLSEHCNGGFINLRFLPSGENLFIPLTKIDSIPSILEAHKGQNAHLGVATRRDGDGTKEGIIEIPSLWCDVDTEGLGEEAKNEIRQRYQDFPLKPSILLNSGGGMHIYWKLKTPATKEEIPLVESLLKRIALYFGGDLSSTDASRILRIPKTLNYKYSPPREVTIIAFKPKKEYNVSNFAFLPEVASSLPEERQYHQETNERLNQIMECEFLKHCDRDKVTLSEPEWYAMISILARETGGPNLIHALSRGYPQYSPQETDKKVLHAINDSGPATCERIKSLWDCGKDCGVKSPASLAIKSSDPLVKENESKNHKHHFSLIQAKDILSTEEPETAWLWEGILPMGGLSLVVSKPKVGKTTLAFNLAVVVSRGDDFLNRKTQKGTVVYLALEEKRGEIQKALSMLNVQGESLFFHFGPAPIQAMQEVEPLIRQTGAKLLVIDILQKFCRVRDLNDYAQVTRALEPLMATARELNCHILLTHHAGKADRPDGDDILGSTGLLGGVDTSIHIKRRSKESKGRIVFTIQRYGEDLLETVVTLRPEGGLVATGGREEIEVEETIPLILEKLNDGPLTEKEIGGKIEKGHSIVSKALHQLFEQKKINRTGGGKRSDPYIYEKDSLLLSSLYMQEGRRETKSGDNPQGLLRNISPDDFQKNHTSQERIGRAFPAPKRAEKDQKGNAIDLTDSEIEVVP